MWKKDYKNIWLITELQRRRKCEEFILDGRVKVNGKVVTELGTKINPDKDIIEFDGKKVEKVEKHVYILLNKPIGYVTTVKDQFDRPTVLDLVKIKEKSTTCGQIRYVYIWSINAYK